MAAEGFSHVLKGRKKGLPSEKSSDFSSYSSITPNQSSPMLSSEQDPWLSVNVKPVDVVEIVLYCTQEIKERGLSVPLLLLPFRPSSDNNGTRNLITQLLIDGRMRGDVLKGELGLTSVMVIVGVLKWIWNRIEGGVVGYEAYELFKTGEADSGFPMDAFTTFMPLCVESDAHAQIIEAFFELLASVAANSKSTGLTSKSVSSIGGWFAFGYDASEWSFDSGYAAWIRAANASSHLFYAYLRGQDTEESMFRQPALPATLQKALDDVSYPPKARDNGLPVKKVNFSCERVSPTPFDLLQRLAYTELPQTQNPASLFYPLDLDNPSGQLSFECGRVWKCIVATNQSSNFRTPETLYDQNWSKFQDSGFNGLEQTENLPNLGTMQSPVSRIRPNGIPRRQSTPSWGDFLSTGFEDYMQGSPVLLSPEQQLPPISTRPAPTSPRFSLSSLDRGRVDDVVTVDLDDAFWYVWIESLSNETPEVKKGVFGRCIVAELDAPMSDWIIIEEKVRHDYQELPIVQERSQAAPKKKLFSTKRNKAVIVRKELPALPTDYQQRRVVSEKRAERVQNTAAALQQQRQRTASAPLTVQPDRNMSRTPSNMAFNNLFTREAQDAFKWTNAYDKHTQQDTYLNGFDPYLRRESSGQQSIHSNGYFSREFHRTKSDSSAESITPDQFSTPMELPTVDSPFSDQSVPRKMINEPSSQQLRFDPLTPPNAHKGSSFSASTPALLPTSPNIPTSNQGSAMRMDDSRRASFSSYQPSAPEVRARPRAISDAHVKPKTSFWGHRKSESVGSTRSNEKGKPFSKFVNFFKFGQRRRASEGLPRSKIQKSPKENNVMKENYGARSNNVQMGTNPRKDYSPLIASTTSPRSKNSLEQNRRPSPRSDPSKSLPQTPIEAENVNRYKMIETGLNPVGIRRVSAQNELAMLGNDEHFESTSSKWLSDGNDDPFLQGLAIRPVQDNSMRPSIMTTEDQYSESVVPLFYDAKERNSQRQPSPDPPGTPMIQQEKNLEIGNALPQNEGLEGRSTQRQPDTFGQDRFENRNDGRVDLDEDTDLAISRHHVNDRRVSFPNQESAYREGSGSNMTLQGQEQEIDINHYSQYYDTEEPVQDNPVGGQEWRESATSDILQDYNSAEGQRQDDLDSQFDVTHGHNELEGGLTHSDSNIRPLDPGASNSNMYDGADSQSREATYEPLGRVSNRVRGFAESIVNGELDWRQAPMAQWPLDNAEDVADAEYATYSREVSQDTTPRFVEYRIEGRIPIDELVDPPNIVDPPKNISATEKESIEVTEMPSVVEETAVKMSPETRRTRTLAARDRWAYIRQNASERAKTGNKEGNSPCRISEELSIGGSPGSPVASRNESREQVMEDPDTSDEENVDVKIARIKARVAHLTGMPE